MAKSVREKNLIQGNIPPEIKEEFDRQISEQGMTVGRVVEAMSRLWIGLPPEAQLHLYSRKTAADAISCVAAEIACALMDAQAQQKRTMLAGSRLKKKQENPGHSRVKPEKSAG